MSSSQASQTRLLTAPTSKLTKPDIVSLLRKPESWILLPRPTRETLYSLLPSPKDNEPAHDPDIHPLQTQYKRYLEEELRRWQEDLKEGRETKKWREKAVEAGRKRVRGEFEECVAVEREEYWGVRGGGEGGKEDGGPKCAEEGVEGEEGTKVEEGAKVEESQEDQGGE